MSGQLGRTVLDAGHFGTAHAAGMASFGFAEAAMLAAAARLRGDAGWGLRAAWSAKDPAMERFVCEVKHHG